MALFATAEEKEEKKKEKEEKEFQKLVDRYNLRNMDKEDRSSFLDCLDNLFCGKIDKVVVVSLKFNSDLLSSHY